MHTVSFLEKLLTRLKSGDTRSIHLNALPGNFARLDIYDLSNINTSLHLSFLESLLTKKNFRFTITIEPDDSNEKTAEQKKIIQRIIKRLNHLEYQEREEYAEHGYTSFGFGYPLLIKRDPTNPERILKAPLLIWHLSLKKDTQKNNTWIISRTEEQPLIFNELLQSHFESVEKIKTDDLEHFIEDDFIDEKQLIQFCSALLGKFHLSLDEKETLATILPCTNKEAIENYTKEKVWIRWSGVFGLYKMQKQPIIKDVELLLNKVIPETENNTSFQYFDGEVLTPVTLDPSQENVLHQLQEHNRIIIQGPPGTGKSQTLTAIITQALLNKQKVLVVCEKRTAMEVLHDNLKKADLHHLCAIVEDVYGDRKQIVERVRQLLEDTSANHRFRHHEYEQDRTKFLTLQEELNFQINFSQKEIFGDDNWVELITKSIELNLDKECSSDARHLEEQLNLKFDYSFSEFRELSDIIKQAEQLYKKIHSDASIFNQLNELSITTSQNEKLILEQIDFILKNSSALGDTITSNVATHQDNFNELNGFTLYKLKFLSIFSDTYKKIKSDKSIILNQYAELKTHYNQYFYTQVEFIENPENFEQLLNSINNVRSIASACLKNEQLFKDYYVFKRYIIDKNNSIQKIVNTLIKTNCSDWEKVFTTFYLNQIIKHLSNENSIKEDSSSLIQELQQRDLHLKQQLSNKIKNIWQQLQEDAIKQKDSTQLKYLYNQRKNKQFSSRNSLRKIIHEDVDFFTTLFPVLMVNPSVCTSVLPLEENLFDFIILDEASQLRLEDTYSSLLRAKIKIVSGDRHQMPPSNFFGSEVIFWEAEEEEDNTGNFLAESKSLLEFADDGGYKNSYLDFHYRSLHPDLIQFSNHAFYQSRLIPMPVKSPYQAIYYTNINGTYHEGVNIQEAESIVDFIYNLKNSNGEVPSVGVATFNIFQRNLILDKLYERAYIDKEKNEHLQSLLNNGLFVKNLENIQGDERDIMLLSTTFGNDENGKFRQAFGPLTQQKGYQLLNVIITRAKSTVHVFTSIPEAVFIKFEEELVQKGNTGKSIFYAYLSYVKAVSENNVTQQQYILNVLSRNNNSIQQQKTESSITFKHLVYQLLEPIYKNQIQENYSLGGFHLDIVIFKNNIPFLCLDFENSLPYHQDVTYRNKLYKQQMLAHYGILTHHVWAYNWWLNTENEIDKIKSILPPI